MNIRHFIAVATVIANLASAAPALAHGANPAESHMVYTNAAYTRAISGTPNPAPETRSPEAQILYVDQAYGPAIYSYPGRDGESGGSARKAH